MIRIRFVALLSVCLVLATAAQVRAQAVSNADDNARILAGLEPAANSPLNRLTQDQSFKSHVARFDMAFGRLDGEQLAKVREWSGQNVNSRRQMMYYLFSGPDFLYANAFFPNATTYIFAGLEPVGPIPDLAKLPRGSIGSTLRNIQVSLGSILSVSYFITAHMKTDLNSGPVFGTLPILYVFLVRTGHTIRDVTLVNLDEEGNLRLGDGVREKSTARGVRIGFSTSSGDVNFNAWSARALRSFNERERIIFFISGRSEGITLNSLRPSPTRRGTASGLLATSPHNPTHRL